MEIKTTETNYDFNKEFITALDFLNQDSKKVLFITGKAGTGKSTLLDYFRMHTEKNVAILAPTGVAALNIKGQTIHSFFKFKPAVDLANIKRLTKAKRKIYSCLDMVIIDEISMARADIIDCIDLFLRLNRENESTAFGGVKVVFFGDLYQLPPVISSEEEEVFLQNYLSPFFFCANVFNNTKLEIFELKTVYRQEDENFIQLLNNIRLGTLSQEEIDLLNKRVVSFLDEPIVEYVVYLTTTNRQANRYNQKYLNRLSGEIKIFPAQIEGDINPSYFPAPLFLELKVGAQVMLLTNDPFRRWVNGSVAKVVDMEEDIIWVEMEDGRIEGISHFCWDIFRYVLNHQQQRLQVECIGRYKQFPLKLAWAITIHKSQGKTFERVILDPGENMFAPGQLYVALSRCRSLQGIWLTRPINTKHLIFPAIEEFLKNNKNIIMHN